MTFLVTAIAPATSNAGQASEKRAIHDTEEASRVQAEKWLKDGYREVSIWQQIATPRIEQTIIWDERVEA